MKAAIIFTGSGPILVLTTFEPLDSPEFVEKLAARGITKFIAREVAVEQVKKLYGTRFSVVSADLAKAADLRVMDIDGHHVFHSFTFEEMGPPVYHPAIGEAQRSAALRQPQPEAAEESAGGEWVYVQIDEYCNLVDASYVPMIGSHITPSIPVQSAEGAQKARFRIDEQGIIYNASPEVLNGHRVVLHGHSSPPLGRTDAEPPAKTWKFDPVSGWTCT
jgi:hypothetical protein